MLVAVQRYITKLGAATLSRPFPQAENRISKIPRVPAYNPNKATALQLTNELDQAMKIVSQQGRPV